MRWLLVFMLLVPSLSQAEDSHDSEEMRCLALNVYHEARGEGWEGMFAVAFVTRNRVRDSGYPDTYCGVVWERRYVRRLGRFIPQFSWTLDGRPDTPFESMAWRKAQLVAWAVYTYEVASTVGDSLYYHTVDIRPVWASRLYRHAVVGRHVFYVSEPEGEG